MATKTALLGDPVRHSVSAPVFREIFNGRGIVDYEHHLIRVPKHRANTLLPLTIEDLRRKGFLGVNVTLPFKETVSSVCDYLSKTSYRCKAVNVLRFEGDQVVGHNTDGSAATAALHALLPLSGGALVIFGAGGTARAIAFSAAEEG
jgi:shikimate dehydrogenase